MKDLQSMARKSIKGDGDTHRIYSTKLFNTYICIMDSYHKRKKVLEEKYCKLISFKPFNVDSGIVDKGLGPLPQQQKFVKQLQDITDEEGLKRAYETKGGLYQH